MSEEQGIRLFIVVVLNGLMILLLRSRLVKKLDERWGRCWAKFTYGIGHRLGTLWALRKQRGG